MYAVVADISSRGQHVLTKTDNRKYLDLVSAARLLN